MRLHRVPTLAPRCGKGSRPRLGTEKPAYGATTAVPGYALYAGQPFRQILRDLGLTSNQVWGLTKTDELWSTALDAALMAARRDDLEHGTNAAYVAGCVCADCRAHQRTRMGRNLG
jgi:hypothetical protein